MKKECRLLALVLAVVMAFSSVSAFAEGATTLALAEDITNSTSQEIGVTFAEYQDLKLSVLERLAIVNALSKCNTIEEIQAVRLKYDTQFGEGTVRALYNDAWLNTSRHTIDAAFARARAEYLVRLMATEKVEDFAALKAIMSEAEYAEFEDALTEEERTTLAAHVANMTVIDTTTDPVTFGENTFSAAGVMPVGASIVVQKVEQQTVETIDDILGLSTIFEEGYRTGAFDISLNNNGTDVQPSDDGVVLSMGGLNVGDNEYIEIFHFLDDASAVSRAVENGTAMMYTDSKLVNALSKEAEAAQSATNNVAVYAEKLTSKDGSVLINEEGTITLRVTSFSKYFYTIGNYVTTYASEVNDSMWGKDGDIYYVIPGATLSFRQDQSWREEEMSYNFSTSRNNPEEREYFTWEYITSLPTDEKDENGDIITRGQNHFRIHSDAAGQTINLICTAAPSDSGLTQTGNQKITIKVLSINDYAAETFKGETGEFGRASGINFVVQKDSTYVPNEPIRNTESTWFNASSWTDAPYELNANNYIEASLAQSSNLKNTTDSTNTIGSVESAYGQLNRSYIKLTDDQWHSFLKAAVSSWGTLTAAGGDTVNQDNIDEKVNVLQPDGTYKEEYKYQIWPHVIKLHTGNSGGESFQWHVDCSVARVDYVSLSYDRNLGENMQAQGKWVYPSSSMKALNAVSEAATFSIEYPKDGNNNNANLPIGSKLNVLSQVTNEVYEYEFLGWNTKADGSGVTYSPGDSIDIKENTILYAKWKTTLVSGGLKISKYVEKAYENDMLPDDEFEFKVTFSGTVGTSASYTYKVEDNGSVVADNLSLTNGGTITLKNGQTAAIANVPVGGFTVVETAKEKYSTKWTPEETNAESEYVVSGQISGGVTSEVTCTNTYLKQKGDLTIVKTGLNSKTYDQGDYESAIFKVECTDKSKDDRTWTVAISPTDGGVSGIVTLKDLIVGASYTITEQNEWTWRYTPDSEVKTVENLTAEGAEVNFSNTRDKVYWLSGDNFKVNKFAKVSTPEVEETGTFVQRTPAPDAQSEDEEELIFNFGQ